MAFLESPPVVGPHCRLPLPQELNGISPRGHLLKSGGKGVTLYGLLYERGERTAVSLATLDVALSMVRLTRRAFNPHPIDRMGKPFAHGQS